jgi:ribonuclease R
VEEECKHSSAREKLAANAERASIKFKQVEFMVDEIGNTFKGVVSGLTERGMYIEIEENKCEGMVRLSDIPGDEFELDKDNYRIVGRRTKRIIQFGDVMEVVVKSAKSRGHRAQATQQRAPRLPRLQQRQRPQQGRPQGQAAVGATCHCEAAGRGNPSSRSDQPWGVMKPQPLKPHPRPLSKREGSLTIQKPRLQPESGLFI